MSEVMEYLLAQHRRVIPEQTTPHVGAQFLHRVKPELLPDPEIVRLVHQLFLTEHKLRRVVFTGVEHGVGCSRMAAGTASLLASSGHAVCLVEANFASPSLAERFGIAGSRGLKDVLASDPPMAGYTHVFNKGPGLSLLPCGRSSDHEALLLDPSRLRSLLNELQNAFEYVVIDAAPPDHDETLSFVRVAGPAVLVLEADQTRRTKAVAVANAMRALKLEIVGAVLNKRTFPIPEKIYRRL